MTYKCVAWWHIAQIGVVFSFGGVDGSPNDDHPMSLGGVGELKVMQGFMPDRTHPGWSGPTCTLLYTSSMALSCTQ